MKISAPVPEDYTFDKTACTGEHQKKSWERDVGVCCSLDILVVEQPAGRGDKGFVKTLQIGGSCILAVLRNTPSEVKEGRGEAKDKTDKELPWVPVFPPLFQLPPQLREVIALVFAFCERLKYIN